MELHHLADDLALALHEGEGSRWKVARLLDIMATEGLPLDQVVARLRARGTELPSAGRRSVMLTTYRAWVKRGGAVPNRNYFHQDLQTETGGLIPLSLSGIAFDKLYLLHDQVTPDNVTDLLAYAYTRTEDELRRERKARRLERGGGEEADVEPDDLDEDGLLKVDAYRSVRIDKTFHDRLEYLTRRLQTLDHNPHISVRDVLHVLIEEGALLDDRGLEAMWRAHHGELTP